MRTVRDILSHKRTNDVASISHDRCVLEAAGIMNDLRIGSLVVVNGDRVVGIFTERDVLRRVVALLRDPAETTVADVMSTPCVVCHPDDLVDQCQAVMTQERIRHLPVVEGAQLVGILTAGDIMATAVRERNVEIQYLQDYLYGGSSAG